MGTLVEHRADADGIPNIAGGDDGLLPAEWLALPVQVEAERLRSLVVSPSMETVPQADQEDRSHA